MGVNMGHTTITCKHCGTTATIDNNALETMLEHRCPACSLRMTDYEATRLKMHYYLLLTLLYQKHWGDVAQYENFIYDICLLPNCEIIEPEGNENRKSGKP